LATVLSLAVLAALTSCSSGMSEDDLAQAEYREHLQEQQQYEPTEEQLQAEADAKLEQWLNENAYWTCVYDPTMNDNWHDDVLCSNGVSSKRPTLLPDDPFVTYDEIMQAAADYEARLNR
jgi:hypothetical protein